MVTQENNKRNEHDVEAYLYASDKARLMTLVKEMAKKAGVSLEKAVTAMQNFNHVMAQSVIDEDDAIDEMEEKIDQECLYSIAMRQPVREDLRFVYAVMKIIVDLERIGDQAVNIAMNVKRLPGKFGFPTTLLPYMLKMSEEDNIMLAEVVQALTREDDTIVCSTKTRRRKVRDIRDDALANLSTLSASEAGEGNDRIIVLLLVMLTFRHLSRISDHILNLAERVSFIATGISPLILKRKAKDEKKDKSL